MSLEQKLEYFKARRDRDSRKSRSASPLPAKPNLELAYAHRERHDSRRRHHPGAHPGTRAHYQEDVRRPRGAARLPSSFTYTTHEPRAARTGYSSATKEQIKGNHLTGAKLLKGAHRRSWPTTTAEYSPESFTGTEPNTRSRYANAVLNVWQPTPDRKAIINLPATVEMSLPHVFAQQVEYMSRT